MNQSNFEQLNVPDAGGFGTSVPQTGRNSFMNPDLQKQLAETPEIRSVLDDLEINLAFKKHSESCAALKGLVTACISVIANRLGSQMDDEAKDQLAEILKLYLHPEKPIELYHRAALTFLGKSLPIIQINDVHAV